MVILITGRKDAGKTTLGMLLCDVLRTAGVSAVMLDGDEYRKETSNKDFSDEGRKRNLLGAAEVAKEIEAEGKTVIMAFVAPKKEWRDAMRDKWRKSRIVYLPGGTLWPNTTYEVPDEDELQTRTL